MLNSLKILVILKKSKKILASFEKTSIIRATSRVVSSVGRAVGF